MNGLQILEEHCAVLHPLGYPPIYTGPDKDTTMNQVRKNPNPTHLIDPP